MKKIEKGTILSLFVNIISLIVAAMIIWPLLDRLFDGDKFKYTVYEYIVLPAIFGVIAGIIFWLFERRKIRKEQNNKIEENK